MAADAKPLSQAAQPGVSRFRGIVTRIAMLAVLPAIIATLLTGMAGIHAVVDLRQSEIAADLAAAAEQTQRNMAASEQRMLGYAIALSQQAALRAAVASGDLELARSRIITALSQIRRTDPTVVVLEVVDRTGRVMVRGHQPELSGDDKSRMVNVARALGGEEVVGMAISVTSRQLNYGATIPLRENGVVVGTLQVGGRFDNETATGLASQFRGEAILLVGDQVSASTLPQLQGAQLQPLLAADSPARSPEGVSATLGDADYLVRILPQTDLEGRVASALLLAVPLAHWQAAQAREIMTISLLGLLIAVVALAVALLASSRLAGPLRGMAGAMRDMAGGNLRTSVPGRGRHDEVGAMAEALETFRIGLSESARLRSEAEATRSLRERRAMALDGYTRDFGQSIAGVMTQLEQASGGMTRAATGMSEAVQQTRGQASETSGAAAEASENLAAVAAAVEEMVASVAEISRQVASAARVATEAVDEARAADTRMQALTGSADRVGDILGLIADVASRTNLLALNATIEAARAGEAGKGFAVVASEVKQLAAQTARATEDVATQIASMRGAASDAAAAMGGITRTIARIDEVATTIAAAVEEQGASTREITQRLQGVAASTSGVSEAMGKVLGLAEQSGAVSGEVRSAASDIGSQAATLRAEVQGFLDNLREDVQERRAFHRRRVEGQTAEIRFAGEVHRLPLIDLSAGGAGLRFERSLPPGTRLTVTLPDMPPIDGRAARCSPGVLGVVFNVGQEAALDEAMVRLCLETA